MDDAVAAVGGLEAFQQCLGVSRRTVFIWKQQGVPAERAPAVEAATGIPRQRLRPDLWPDTIMPANTDAPDPLAQNRAGAFALLGALLAAPPDAGLLRAVAALPDGETALGQSIAALARAAAVDPAVLEREFHDLFIGVGRGEILPYASWYLTGFLHERPLADLRGSLQALAVARAPGVAEPEDHIAFLCETMAGLLRGDLLPTTDGFGAAGFLARHIQPWAGRLFADLMANQGSAFYRAVGGFGRAVLDIETLAAELPE